MGMHSGGFTTFQPASDSIAELLTDLNRADISFAEAARKHHTTPELLALFLTRPDIRDRIEATDRVVTWRTRIVASNNLTAAIGVLNAILEDFNRARAERATRAADRCSEQSVPNAQTPSDSHDTHLRRELVNLRTAENARRAAAALIRLTNLRPTTYARVEAAAAAPKPAVSRPAAPAAPQTPIAPPAPAEPAQSSRPIAPPPSQATEAVQPAPDPHTTKPPERPSPAPAPAAFEQLLAKFADLAANHPELLETLESIAGTDQLATGPPEHPH